MIDDYETLMDHREADDLFSQALAAIKANRHDEARNLLIQLVSADPQHEQAWLWLADLVSDQEETISCLERVLALNPNNAIAAEWLSSLRLKEASQRNNVVDSEDPERGLPRLGSYLLHFRHITAEQLKAAVLAQEREAAAGRREKIGQILVKQGLISEEQLNQALEEQQRDYNALFVD